MPYMVLGAVILLAVLVVELGFIPPFHATTLIQIRNGTLHLERGHLQARTSEHVRAIIREAQVVRGYIAITPGRRVFFSRLIPPEVHQRLRNVLLNQWR